MTNTLKLVGIAGSLRRASTNRGMLRAAQALLPADTSLDILDLTGIPFYNADMAAAERPAALNDAITRITEADALVFACNEYNYSLAPALKNIIDWASREPDNRALSGKAAAIMGAAGGMGSSRAQYHLRQVCVFVNLHPLNQPEVFANAFTDSFDTEGNLVDPRLRELVQKQMQALRDFALQLKK